MAPSEQEQKAAPVKVDYGEQDENGVDLSLLRRNLRLTPAQRLARLQQAVDSFPKRRDG